MSDDEKIESVMKEAAQFSARGMERFISELPEGQQELNKAADESRKLANSLEVHYLFPNLTDRERAFLVELRGARRGLYAAMKADRNGMTPAELEQHDQAGAELQKRYVNARTELGLLNTAAKMTDLQRKILEREFLSLPLSPLSTGGRADGAKAPEP
jgi:hypothetical protein